MSNGKQTIKDLAISLDKYPCINEEQSLHEAIEILRSFTCGEHGRLRYGELLVINQNKQLSGLVTMGGILQGLDPRLPTRGKDQKFEGKGADYPNLAILWEDSFFKECAKQSSRSIKDYMSPVGATVKTTDPFLKALYIMLANGEMSLPVIDGDTVVGILRMEEVFDTISGMCEL